MNKTNFLVDKYIKEIKELNNKILLLENENKRMRSINRKLLELISPKKMHEFEEQEVLSNSSFSSIHNIYQTLYIKDFNSKIEELNTIINKWKQKYENLNLKYRKLIKKPYKQVCDLKVPENCCLNSDNISLSFRKNLKNRETKSIKKKEITKNNLFDGNKIEKIIDNIMKSKDFDSLCYVMLK